MSEELIRFDADESFYTYYANLLLNILNQDFENLYAHSIHPSRLNFVYAKIAPNISPLIKNKIENSKNEFEFYYEAMETQKKISIETKENALLKYEKVKNANKWEELNEFLHYYEQNSHLFEGNAQIQDIIESIQNKKKELEMQFEYASGLTYIQGLQADLVTINTQLALNNEIIQKLNNFYTQVQKTRQFNVLVLEACYRFPNNSPQQLENPITQYSLKKEKKISQEIQNFNELFFDSKQKILAIQGKIETLISQLFE